MGCLSGIELDGKARVVGFGVDVDGDGVVYLYQRGVCSSSG